jgi:hypothetical protein
VDAKDAEEEEDKDDDDDNDVDLLGASDPLGAAVITS